MSYTGKDKEQIIADLIRTINDARSWSERSQAADALIDLGEPAVKPLMLKIRQHFFTFFTFPEAVRALGCIGSGSEQTVDLLIEILSSNHVHAAQEAAKGLGRIGNPRAIPALIDVFRHDWNDEETFTIQQIAASALAEIGDAALSSLILALQDGNSTVRAGVVSALGKLKDKRAVLPLVQMLQDIDSQVRAGIADALAEVGDRRAVEPLITLLKDEDWYVRCRVLYALGEMGTSYIFDIVVDSLQDAQYQVRAEAVTALGKIQDERRMSTLLALLKNSHSEVRGSAILALAKVANEQALPTLQWMQQNDTGYWGANRISDHATYAIKCIQERISNDNN